MTDVTTRTLASYYEALGRRDSDAAFTAVGRLMAQTCPYEPHDEQGEPLAGPQLLRANETQAFLASDAAFQDLCKSYGVSGSEPENVELGEAASDRYPGLAKFSDRMRGDWSTVAQNLARNPAYEE